MRLLRRGGEVESVRGPGRGLGESVWSERHYEMTVVVIILALIVAAGVVTARRQ